MSVETIDLPTFRALQDATGREFVAELAGTFLEEAPAILRDLRAAQKAADADRFRRAAHSLKSNALTFGALALAAMAKALELGGLPSDAAGVDALALELARVASRLGTLRDA